MTNDSDPQLQAGTSVKSPPSNTSADTRQADRSELVQKAKVFLESLQVRNEDLAAKRRFLIEKGLNAQEIDTLLQETIARPLLIPPRTYPQPPPSNLPNLLIGFFRIFSWLAGGSAVFLLLYFRYIFPRLTQSFQARLSLHSQQRDLLQKLTVSLADLKASQTKAFADLPRPQLHQEDVQYKDCHSLDAVFNLTEEVQNIPPITLLRCAIEELALKSEAVTADAIFSALETRWTWLQTEEGSDFAAKLWDTLTTVPLFAQEEKDGVRVWSYKPPTAPTSPPVLISLSELRTLRFHGLYRRSDLRCPSYVQTSRYRCWCIAASSRRRSASRNTCIERPCIEPSFFHAEHIQTNE
ncbi:unnamed protein product [Somion occarium]|uniref:Peroxisomal membrane protein PEX14 n=1 Tax=Somion occarium TaxID=3059160 RepID=A0ABP1D3N7_9APHY